MVKETENIATYINIYKLRYFCYNGNGWLGIKHQVTYLLRYLKSQVCKTFVFFFSFLVAYNITEIEITEGQLLFFVVVVLL